MSFVRGLENANIQLLAPVTTTVEDRTGYDVEEETFEPVLTTQCRFEDESELAAGEFARFVANVPAVFIDPDRIPDDLHTKSEHLPTDAEWPYVDEHWRAVVMHQTYAVDKVHTESLDQRTDADLLSIEMEVFSE